jgi:hypothetical protein
MIRCPGTGESTDRIHPSGALMCPACNGAYFSAGLTLDYHEVEAESPVEVGEDFCGCCGDAMPGPATGRNWCSRCVLHLGSTHLPPWERTYEAVTGTPCPFQVGSPADG